MSKQAIFLTLAVIVVIAGSIVLYNNRNTSHSAPPTTSDEAIVRSQTEAFGKALQKVSLLAPASALAASMNEAYGPYVAPELLAMWKTDPSQALGRQTSSPWPDHIAINSLTKTNSDYTVHGTVVEVANTATGIQTAATYPVTLTFSKRNSAWLITKVTKGAYNQSSSQPPHTSTSTSTQPNTPQTTTNNTVSIVGTGECLPNKDTSGPQTLECALGLRTDAGLHYALNLEAAGGFSTFTSGARMKITGTITPASALGTALEKYAIEGRINATKVERI